MDTKDVPGRTFGQWLQHKLDLRDWNKADLARRMGVQNSDVSRWTRDKRKPRPETVDEIADALDVDLDEALAAAGYRPSDIPIDPDSAIARLMPLIEKIDWETIPGRVEEVEAELRAMIETDRKIKAQKKERQVK